MTVSDPSRGGVDIGQTKPTNPPEALRTLLQFWKSKQMPLFINGFEDGNAVPWSSSNGN